MEKASKKTFAHIHGRAELRVNLLTINSISYALIERHVVGEAAIPIETHLLYA
jgi:hypothetical protein